jgi:SHS family sialic acid transporter-like MFS transporter
MPETPSAAAIGLRSLTGQQWKVFGAAWLGYFLDGFDFVLIALVLTEVKAEFGLSDVTGATLISAAFVTRWAGGLLLGAVGDRFGRKPAMVISIICFAVGSLLCGFAWNYWSMFVFRAIIGIGMAGEYGASVTYAMESWPDRLRNRASGMLLSAYPVGVTAASLLYGWIVPAHGWRWMFYVGVVPIVLALAMRRGLPEAEEWKREVADAVDAPPTAMHVLLAPRRRLPNVLVMLVLGTAAVLIFSGNAGGLVLPLSLVLAAGFVSLSVQLMGRLWPMVLMLMLTVGAAFLYSWPIQALLPTYLKEDLGFDPGAVSTILVWAGLGYAAGSVLSGVVADKIGTRPTYVIGLVLSLIVVVPVFRLDGDHLWQLAVLLFLLQMVSQGISGLLPKYLSDHFPTRLRAAGLGFTYNVGALGGALAPILGTRLAGQFDGLGTALMVLALGFTTIVALLIGVDAAARIGRALRVPSDAPALRAPAEPGVRVPV